MRDWFAGMALQGMLSSIASSEMAYKIADAMLAGAGEVKVLLLPNCTHRSTCRACDSSDLAKVFDLGSQPPANAFLRPDQFDSEKRYPLALYFCRGCSLVQLLDVVRPDILFNEEYKYAAKASQPLVDHFKAYAEKEILPRVGSQAVALGNLVVDIGGNDGLLLSFVYGARVINVDPAASGDEVPSICEPFTEIIS